MKKPGALAKNQSGQAMVEYILLLTIVVVGAGFFMQTLSKAIDQMTAAQGGKLERQIRTGSAPASLWKK